MDTSSFDHTHRRRYENKPQPAPNGREPGGGIDLHELLAALPAAIYTTDAEGRITYYNAAAAQLWGCEPEHGTSTFCGSWRLYWPDGRPMRHDECPMAETLKTGKPVRGGEAVAERPDGRRVPFIPYPTPLFDSAGRLVGAVNMLVDITERKAIEQAMRSQTRLFQTLNGIAQAVASELNLERIVRTATDIAVEVSGARFGAFLMNSSNPHGTPRVVHALPTRETFERLRLNETLLGATLRGGSAVRMSDIRTEDWYEARTPPREASGPDAQVVSYLAIPVGGFGRIDGALVARSPRARRIHAGDGEDRNRHRGAFCHCHRQRPPPRARQTARRHCGSVCRCHRQQGPQRHCVSSWNHGAERLFGYTAEEMIGQPVTLLIPADRLSEEDEIIEHIRRGERVEHYETVRARKDGTPVDVSLSVSPVKDAEGRIIGASKIARDITERKQAEVRQELLVREVHHRTRNLFAVVDAVVWRSFAGKLTVKEAEVAVRDRLHSLAQTHTMLLDKEWRGVDLDEVVRAEMAPYAGRVAIEGPPILLNTQAAQNFAMALHELATNAAKYGALSDEAGQVLVTWSTSELNGRREFHFRWEERGGPPVAEPEQRGFGSAVLEQVMAEYFDKPPQITFASSGVTYELSGSLEALTAKA